jgi:hypothetical protein
LEGKALLPGMPGEDHAFGSFLGRAGDGGSWMTKKILLLDLLLLGFLVGGCIPVKWTWIQDKDDDAVRNTLGRVGRTVPEKIMVYDREVKIGHPYIKLAKIVSKLSHMKAEPEKIMEEFKVKASELGANALLVEEVTDEENTVFVIVAPVTDKSYGQRVTAIYVDYSKEVSGVVNFKRGKSEGLEKPLPLEHLSYPPKR